MNLEKAKEKAQRESNKCCKRIAVINVNIFVPKYVTRIVPDVISDADLTKDRGIIFVAHPQ